MPHTIPDDYYICEFFSRCRDMSRSKDTISLARHLHQRALLERNPVRVHLEGLRDHWIPWQLPSGRLFYQHEETQEIIWNAPKS